MNAPAPADTSSDDRNAWIDVLRGLAALAVTLFHFNCVLPPPPGDLLERVWRATWAQGHLGVPVFFVLSGYCIFQSWPRSSSPLAFIGRRLRRIFPAYLGSLGVVLAVVAIGHAISGVNDVTPLPRAPSSIAATLLLLTAPLSAVPTVNWVYWTLSYELAFYLLAGALLLFRPPQIRLALFALLQVTLCLLAATGFHRASGPWFFVALWPLFGAGAALALQARAPRLAPALLLVAILALGVGGFRDGNPAYAAVGGVSLLFILFTRRLPLPACVGALRTCGEFSYSLYLVHVPLGVYGAQRLLLLAAAPDSGAGLIAVQVGALICTLALARGFFLLAEKPFLHVRPAS